MDEFFFFAASLRTGYKEEHIHTYFLNFFNPNQRFFKSYNFIQIGTHNLFYNVLT